jgi:hypothetical protein
MNHPLNKIVVRFIVAAADKGFDGEGTNEIRDVATDRGNVHTASKISEGTVARSGNGNIEVNMLAPIGHRIEV